MITVSIAVAPTLSSCDERVEIRLVKEIDFSATVKASKCSPQDVHFASDGRVVARVTADGMTRFVVTDKTRTELATYEGRAASDNVLHRALIAVEDKSAYYVDGGDLCERSIVDGKAVAFARLPGDMLLGKSSVTYNDDNFVVTSISAKGDYRIDTYARSKKEFVSSFSTDKVSVFCVHGPQVYYAVVDDKQRVEVMVKQPQNEVPKLVFADVGPGCDAIGCSERHIVACTSDGRLVIFERGKDHSTKSARLVRRTITNCIVNDEEGIVYLSSLDKEGVPNVVIYSLRSHKPLSSVSADRVGVSAMAVDTRRREIAVVGGDKVLRILKYPEFGRKD